MWEWFGREWWQFVWVPALAAGTTFIVAAWRAYGDGRARVDDRIDDRMDKWIATQDAEIKEIMERKAELRKRLADCEREAIRWEGVARWWFRKAHSLTHALNNARQKAIGVLERHGQPVSETWFEQEDLPPLEGPPGVAPK